MNSARFNELALSPEMLKAVADMGFEEATPIQSLSIPVILQGRDVTGQAQTGTGKTAAFGIPILETVDAKNKHPQAIVLCPTRELAIQVAEEMKCLARHKKGISILPIYGGQSYDRQFQGLKKGAQVIIGTPGRVMDHLDRGTLKLGTVRMVVLDEADEMLDMGFREDIERILTGVPAERQTVFFSATMPKAFLDLTHKFQKNPRLVKVTHGKLAAPTIEQVYFELKESFKLEALCRVIDMRDIRRALVFCNTKRKVDEVTEHLQTRGYAAAAIHGDMNQSQRERVMEKFRKGAFEILVATDVAARGIDVQDIEAVFNYDLPQDEEYYVHRIGRTGRAGKEGRAFTFVAGKDAFKLREIQRYIKTTITRAVVPTVKDVEQVRANQLFETVREQMDSPDINQYVDMVEYVIGEEYSSLEVAGALLKMALQQQAPAVPAEAPGKYEETGAEKGMVRLFLNVGRKQNVKVGDIVGAIAGETGISGQEIGNIKLHDSFSFVEVPAESADMIISVMKKRNIKGNRVNLTPAKPESTR
ncbi:MAG: DEAD/DEAH box helicase [Endomicrobiales bacterium]